MFSNTFGSRSYFSLLTTFGNCPVEDRKNTGFAHRLLRRKTRTNWLTGKLNNGFSMLTWLGLGKLNTRSLPFFGESAHAFPSSVNLHVHFTSRKIVPHPLPTEMCVENVCLHLAESSWRRRRKDLWESGPNWMLPTFGPVKYDFCNRSGDAIAFGLKACNQLFRKR